MERDGVSRALSAIRAACASVCETYLAYQATVILVSETAYQILSASIQIRIEPMRTRTRNFVLFTVAALALVAGVLYEASTHVARGWLRGEAFYDGRPTSYWRERCDEYIQRFD